MKEAFPYKKHKKITSNNYTPMDHDENTQIRGAKGGKAFLYHTILYHTNSLTLAQRIHWTESEISWFRPNDCAVIYCVSLVSSDHGLYHINSNLTTFILSFNLH